MMGEIGGNEINYGFTQGKFVQEIKAFVTDTINTITDAIREVIRFGALTVVVPGNFQIGWFPFTLTTLPSSDPSAYDDLGCLRSLNELVTFKNTYLQQALASLRLEFPQVTIRYAAYYEAFDSVLRCAPLLGFNKTVLLKSCCGTGGSYNFDLNRICGSPGAPLCSNPTVEYICCDGVHLTRGLSSNIRDSHSYDSILTQDQLISSLVFSSS